MTTEFVINENTYHVEKELGSGAFGVVYKCKHALTGQIVAIKKINSKLPDECLRLEIQCGQRLRNARNVVHQIEADLTQRLIVLEFIDGENLDELMLRAPDSVRANFLEYAIAICRGLRETHYFGVIHRDLKPANVLLKNTSDPVIGDFGLSKIITESVNARTFVGTMRFVAPELLDGKPYDHRVDLFSLGVVFYYIWTGVYPFDSSNTTALLTSIGRCEYVALAVQNPQVPTYVSDLVTKMLAPLSTRIASIQSVLQILLLEQAKAYHLGQINTFDQLEMKIFAIYGAKNCLRSPALLLDHVECAFQELIECTRAIQRNSLDVVFASGKVFGWFCAFTTSINAGLEALLNLKYPNECLACLANPCKCSGQDSSSAQAVNSQILKNFYSKGSYILEFSDGSSIDELENRLAKIFGVSNSSLSREAIALRVYQKLNAIRELLLKSSSVERMGQIDALHLSVASCAAWIVAFIKRAEPELKLSDMLNRCYANNCYKCQKLPCACDGVEERIRFIQWKLA
ncbi:MAG: serine/threonine-protein kinase [Planctomycetota bacterium]